MFGEQRRMEWNFLKPSSFLNTIAAYSIDGLTSLFYVIAFMYIILRRNEIVPEIVSSAVLFFI